MNMLKEMIERYGRDALNSLTKYPSIPTLHEMDRGLLTDVLHVEAHRDVSMGVLDWVATEKLDGTNVRILIGGRDLFLGSQ